MAKIEALGSIESLSRSDVYIDQEGALVVLAVDGSGGYRAEATLTAEQAEAIAELLKETAKEARAYGQGAIDQ